MLGKLVEKKLVNEATKNFLEILNKFDGSRTVDSITKKEVQLIMKDRVKEAMEKISKLKSLPNV